MHDLFTLGGCRTSKKKVGRTSCRYLVKPATENQHIKFVMIKRFPKCIQQIKDSPKSTLKSLLNNVIDETSY